MTNRALGFWLALLAVLVNSASPVLGQGVVAPAPQPTLWSFLGIPQAFKAVREGGINRSGNHPALEKKPPLKKIADPANLVSDNPAIKKAAEIKKEEDLKWQKIKAIKYLTTIGCGCYNRDGSITDALMKAMDDCTEEVRYATILAINGAAGGEMCENCKMRSCCSEEVSNKLYELAYEKDADGCFLEPSERVRLAAAEAIRVCCPGRGDDFFMGGAPVGEVGPPIGEQPGVTPLPGGERPLDAPPPVPVPGEPTPAPPLPPAPLPTLRPISEPLPAAPVIERPAHRPAHPSDPVAQHILPSAEAPRIAVRLPEPPRVASLPQPETMQAAPAKPAVIEGIPAQTAPAAPIVVRPAVTTPITMSAAIAAQSGVTTPALALTTPAPAVTTPAPAVTASAPAVTASAPAVTAPARPAQSAAPAGPPAKPQSSRRTANLPAGTPPQSVAVAARPASSPAASAPAAAGSDSSAARNVPGTTASLPFSGTTPHWTVGSKAPTVFISKPIEPAKPIAPASKTEKEASAESARPAATPEPGQSQMAAQPPETLAPIVPAAAMRRLPPTEEVPLLAPPSETTTRREATPVAFISRTAPAAQPMETSKQRREVPGANFGTGTIGSVRLRDGVAMIEFDTNESLPAGSIIRAYHEYAFAARKTVGDLQVIRSEGHVAIAVPYNGSELTAFTVGDQAIVLR